MLKRIFAPAKNSNSANVALLVLRVWVGLEMLLVHGLGKLTHFHDYSLKFSDPFGIGSTASLGLSVFAEFFVSILIVLGLFTRWSALVLSINMMVAFVVVHKTALSGEHSGELALLYLLAYVVLFLAGPGRFSADKILFGSHTSGKPGR